MSTKQLEKTTSEKKKQKQSKKSAQQSPKQVKKVKQQQTEDKKAAKQKVKKPRIRVFPIWLRIIVIITLAAIALVVGLMIGYGVLGDGKALDALRTETWQHIIDIVKKKE